MIKKCSSYILISICVFFFSLMTSFAKEVTLDELTEMVKEINSSATHVYVIGEYAFTSKHTLTTQDIMLAARSIKVNDSTGKTNKDEIYNEMIITYLKGNIGSNWELETLEFVKNYGGSQVAPKIYDIKFIDYNRIYDQIDLVQMVKDAYDEYKPNLPTTIDADLDAAGTKLTVTIKDFNIDYSADSIKEQAKTLADRFLKEEGIESVTLKFTTSDNNIFEYTVTNDIVESLYAMDNKTLKEELKSFINEKGLTIDSVIGGSVTAKINLEDGYVAKDGIDTFNAECYAELDLAGMADKIYSKYQTSYASKLMKYLEVDYKDETASVLLKTAMVDLDLIPEDKVKSLVNTLFEKAASVPGIESATMTLTPVEGNVITETITIADIEALLNLNQDELVELIKDYINDNNLTVDSVIGSSVTAKVNLKTGYIAKDDIDTFNAEVAAELNIKGLVNAIYNKYESNYANKLKDFVATKKLSDTSLEITLKALLVDSSLIPEDKLEEAKTKLKDVKQLLDKVTYIPGFKSVEVTLTSADGTEITETLTEAQLIALKDMSVDELKTLVKNYIKDNNLTIDSVIGGTLTATVSLKEGYTATEDVRTFSATIKAEIDFKGIINKVYDKYERDYASKFENYVATKKVNDTTLEVTAKVLTTDISLLEEKVNELKGQYQDEISEIRALLDKVTYIPGLESFTVTLTTSDNKTINVNITEEEAIALKDMSVDELKTLVKGFITSNNLTIDSIVGGEATLKINLKNGYAAKDGEDTFKALFKVEYDLKGLVDTAYNKFNKDYAVFLESVATIEKVKDTDTEYNVLVKTTDEAKLTTIANMLKSKAGDLLSQVTSIPGVDNISVKLTTSDDRTFTKNITMAHLELLNNMSVDEIKTALKSLANKHNLTINSILGGNIEAKVNLKKGYSAKENINTFKINLLASAYDVKFDVDGEVTFQSVKVGDKVTKPATPTKEGYTFDKWLLNDEEYDFDAKVNSSITLTASWKINTYEVTIAIPASDTGYGTLSKTTITVEHGAIVTQDGNVLKIGSEEIEAIPTTNTAEYKYSFDKWVGVPAKIESSLTITARFKREDSLYNVNIVAGTDGTVSESLVENVKYGTTIEKNGNTLKIGDKEITAEPKVKDAQYTYSFDSWTVETNTVTKDLTITANFKKEVNTYAVTFSYNDENFGKLNKTLIEVPYGAEIKVEGNKITIGEEIITATPADNTLQYKYSFKEWTNVPDSKKVTESIVIYANFNQTEIDLYTVTFKSNNTEAGYVDTNTITDIPEGTEIKVNGNKITINGETIEAKITDNQDTNYNYSFAKWDVTVDKVNADMTIIAIFKKEPKKYDVSITVNKDAYGSVTAPSINASYDSVITTNENTITIDGTTITATPTTETSTKYYTFENWTVSTNKVTSSTTVTANFKEWTKIDVASYVSSAVTASYGDNALGDSHTMTFAEQANNTIVLKYSGTKSARDFGNAFIGEYKLNGTAVESFDIIQLMEELTNGHDDIYESMIWDYRGWKNNGTEDFDLMNLNYGTMIPFGFMTQLDSPTIFARFMSKTSGLSGGSNFANIDLDKMITNTTSTPIKMTIKLKDGYVTTDHKTEITYNIVFAK